MGIYYSKLSTYFNTLYSKLSSQNTCASICKLLIYRHRTLVLACTVYSTPDVHAFLINVFLLHIPTHLFPWVLANCESISIGRKSNPTTTTTTTRYKKNNKKSAIPQ